MLKCVRRRSKRLHQDTYRTGYSTFCVGYISPRRLQSGRARHEFRATRSHFAELPEHLLRCDVHFSLTRVSACCSVTEDIAQAEMRRKSAWPGIHRPTRQRNCTAVRDNDLDSTLCCMASVRKHTHTPWWVTYG